VQGALSDAFGLVQPTGERMPRPDIATLVAAFSSESTMRKAA